MNKKEQIMSNSLQVLNSINRLSPRFINTNDKQAQQVYNRPILGIIAQQFRIERII